METSPPKYVNQETNPGIRKITELYWKSYSQNAEVFEKKRELAKTQYEHQIELIAKEEKEFIENLDNSMISAISQISDSRNSLLSWLYFWK